MEKIAFLFPGQGSQYVGMGQSFYKKHDIARKTFEEANDILGFDLVNLCFDGSITELSQLENVSPALLTASVAYFRVYMQELGITPQFCAGHSLGEYAAFTCAGAMKFADALRIIRLRGFLTQEVAKMGQSGMTIIDGLAPEVIEAECQKYSTAEQIVGVSCYNSPLQAAISGHNAGIQKVEERSLELGATITPLLASPPLHSPVLKDIVTKLTEELRKYTFSAFQWPVIANVTAKPYGDPSNIISLLTDQLVRPVQWINTLKYLKENGVMIIVEMGPQNILTNLVAANLTGVETVCFDRKIERQAMIERFKPN